MESNRMEVSKEETLVEVVARLVKLQKRIASDCENLKSSVEGPKPMGMTPQGPKKGMGVKSKFNETVESFN